MASIQGRLTFFQARRTASVIVTLATATVTWFALEQVRRSLGDASMASGWTLLASTLGLYGLGLRKRSHNWRLGPVSAWLQVHSYLGTFALIVFIWHVGWPIRGRFELALAAMFLFISISGIVLLFLSRRIPKQLAAVHGDYRLEDIPTTHRELAQKAHELVIESANLGCGATLVEFYQRRLLHFFHSRRSLLYRLLPNGAKRRQLLRELQDLDRYLDSHGQTIKQKLTQLVVAKDDTDFHSALQNRLRFLVTSHVVFTWSLLLMIAVHVILVLRFQGVTT